MILVTFATPPENPFDIPLVKGAATPHDDLLLVLTGIGSPGAARIDDILQSRPEIRGLLEFGGAAAVTNAPIGAHYTVTRLFSTDGNGIGSIEPVPGLPRASASCPKVRHFGQVGCLAMRSGAAVKVWPQALHEYCAVCPGCIGLSGRACLSTNATIVR